MSKRISEQNKGITNDLLGEYKRIEALFSSRIYVGTYDAYGSKNRIRLTLEEALENYFFNGWAIRGKYIDLADMKIALGIDPPAMDKEFNNDRFLQYIQYVLNGVYRINDNHKNSSQIYISDTNILKMIIENCIYVLDAMNYRFEVDKKTREVFIVEKDEFSTAVSELHEDISDKMIEYRRFDLKGNLVRKAEILCTLYKKLESIKNTLGAGNKSKNANQFYQLYTDATFLYDKSGIRHFVEDDYIASKTFLKMSSDELEEWYDKIYDLFLTCILVSNYINIKPEIMDLKRANEVR